MESKFIIDRLNDKVCIFFENDFKEVIHKFKYILVIPFYNSNIVMTYHPKKKLWDFPKTSIVEGEDVIDCASKSGFNDIGAIFTNIQPFAYYDIIKDNDIVRTGVVLAGIEKFEPKPRWSETDIVKLFNKLPENIKNKKVYELLVQKAKSYEIE